MKSFSEFQVEKIILDHDMDGPYALLREVEGVRTIRIQVSLGDAAALMAAYEGIDFPRPMTHDLVVMLLERLSADVVSINIPEFKNNVFSGELVLKHDGKEIIFDCRSSDAINIALRLDMKIFVASEVLDKINEMDKGNATKNGWLNLLAMLADESLEEDEVN